MNARETIQLVVEGKPPNGWATTRGVYANLSNWPREVKYYVKCPKCGLVHGDFKTLKDANLKKLCPTCDMEVVNDLKDEIDKVLHDPDHKPKEMTKLIGENIEPPLPPPPPPEDDEVPEPEPDDDPTTTPQVLATIDRLLLGNWVDVALRQFSDDVGANLRDLTIDEHWSERQGNYDTSDLDATRILKVDVGEREYLIFKDESEAEAYALLIVRSDLNDSPEMFSQDWLRGFIDTDKLSDAIGDPHEEWEHDVRGMYYEDLLTKMVEEGYVESDDTVFFKKNGDQRKENALRAAALNVYMEDYIDKEKPAQPDPWDYLEEIGSKEDAIKFAMEHVGVDIDEAAQSAVNTDGWPHFVARYDGHSYTLENGAVWCRIN